MATTSPVKDLADVTGQDEYVVVYAWVNHIIDLSSHKPYQKGILGDESTRNKEPRKFVVYDPDLRLEKGNKYRIFGRERTYEPFEEIQIEIGEADHVDVLYEAE